SAVRQSPGISRSLPSVDLLLFSNRGANVTIRFAWNSLMRSQAGSSNPARHGTGASTASTNIWTSCRKRRKAMTRDDLIGERRDQKVEITRVFDAPRELVWKAWTDPQHFMRWWGPREYTCPVCEMDFRIGGKYLYCMRSPEGNDYWGTGVFREI